MAETEVTRDEYITADHLYAAPRGSAFPCHLAEAAARTIYEMVWVTVTNYPKLFPDAPPPKRQRRGGRMYRSRLERRRG